MTEAAIPNISEPWLQMSELGETSLWYHRFLLFRDMGPVRTQVGALRLEDRAAGRPEHKGITGAWHDAAKKYSWLERAEAWDKYQREKVFTTGYAYDLNRIQKLDTLAGTLADKVEAMLLNLKPSKGGFQDFLYKSLLETMKALAEETGGRATAAGGKADVNVNVNTLNRVVFFTPDAEPETDIDVLMPEPVEVQE